MKQLALRRWHKLLRRIGYPGILGCAVMAVGAGLTLSLPALQRETRDSLSAIASRSLAARQHAPARAAAAAPVDVARAYIDGFPSLSQNAADIGQIFAAAELHHVQLPKGEYQLKAEPNAAFVTYTATFPIHGDYDAVKGFTADVLSVLPHVAMDELRLSRDSATSTALDAVVRFTFFYRSN